MELGEADAEVLPFIHNMAERLADCDVIICRAGAITVSELCAAGVPSVLVPLVVSTTAHQRDNADLHGRAWRGRAPAAGRDDGRARWPSNVSQGHATAMSCWPWPATRPCVWPVSTCGRRRGR
jgi:hypothetical protein